MSEPINYMGHQWITINDGIVTVGISEEAAADLADDIVLTLPDPDDELSPGKVCGDIESSSGNLNLYSPVSGTVIEINDQVVEDSSILVDDPTDEGWLFKVEADNPDQIDRISLKANSSDDDDYEDEEDEDDEEDPIIDGESES
jgi:glycine cleavage system H protein